MVEQPVDASALAFFEEAEQMSAVVRRGQVLRQVLRGMKKKRKRKASRGALLRRFPRARAVRSWNSGHIPAPLSLAVALLREEYRNVGLFLEYDFMVENVDVFGALLGPSVDTRPCVSLRDIWKFSSVVFLRLLYLAVACSMWVLPEEYSSWFFWEITSGYAVFSASWFDSGYRFIVSPYSAQCSALSGTCYASVTEFANFHVFTWKLTLDPEVDPRRNCGFSAVAAHLQGGSSFWTKLSSCPLRADSAGGPDVQ